MRIFIAGGAGYVGSALVPKLLERGYEVVVADQCWFGNHLPEEVKLLDRDILDLVQSDVEGFDQVVFLAGLSNDPMADYSPSRNFVANAASPAYLAYLAKKAGVGRYIYASSCSTYGYTVNELYDETAPTISNYPYGISKLQGETAAMQLADENFSVIALRKGTVCGYSPRMRLDLVVNTMFKTAVTENVIRVNNPAIWRPILAIQDAVSAYIRAIESSPSISGVFNIASGNYTLGEVADQVHDGVKEFLGIDPRREIRHMHDLRNYKVSIEKAANVISYKPRFNVVGIIEELVAHKHRFNDFDNPHYYNIDTFRAMDDVRSAPATPLMEV